jgi:hypothetical protein
MSRREPSRRPARVYHPSLRPSFLARRTGHVEPTLSPLGVAAIVAGAAFLVAGIAWPQAAEGLLRLLLALLAVGFVLGRAYQAMLPAEMTQDAYSPFHDDGPPPAAVPPALRDLNAQLRAADRTRDASRAEIPRAVRWRVIDEAARRLSERHGLRLEVPEHRAEIRALVSEPTWRLIASHGTGSAGPVARAGTTDPVPLSHLSTILDDLEKL